jgi:hypothetical protein
LKLSCSALDRRYIRVQFLEYRCVHTEDNSIDANLCGGDRLRICIVLAKRKTPKSSIANKFRKEIIALATTQSHPPSASFHRSIHSLHAAGRLYQATQLGRLPLAKPQATAQKEPNLPALPKLAVTTTRRKGKRQSPSRDEELWRNWESNPEPSPLNLYISVRC